MYKHLTFLFIFTYRLHTIYSLDHPSTTTTDRTDRLQDSLTNTLSLSHIKESVDFAVNTLSQQEKQITAIKSALNSILSELPTKDKPKTDKFIGVFDGGSTGTRLNIYQFDEKGLTLLSHLFKTVQGGIHLSKDPSKDIKELLKEGNKYLLEKQHRTGYDFPLVFNGTAGLRLINETARSKLLTLIKNTIINETNRKEVEVRVIDGKEEGFYAWAALVFVTQMKDKIGIFDLGGGSAQISFEIDKNMQGVEEGIVHGKKKDVLSKSFLGMGLFAGLESIKKTDNNNYCNWKKDSFNVNKCKIHMKRVISSLIQKTTQGKEIAPGLSQINTIFVTSFIAEILNRLDMPSTAEFKDIKEIVKSVCVRDKSNPERHSKEIECVNVMYAVTFMESLGVGLFTPIRNASVIPTDISWSLGRALSLLE